MENNQDKIYTYKNLIVWQRSVELAVEIYSLTSFFPKEELYGLVSQMRRSAIFISSNIAEGRCRSSKKDCLHFLRIAYGPGAELETQITIAKKLSKTKDINYSKAEDKLSEVMKMLNVMIRKLNIN
ncbi:MAG: four helix bundle protein [Candidatus Moranbacteria bacterium]|jgi:four helix bundle protein|nr:four helix bundle protein [Candidatus Moranbacteria bacterium]